MLANIDSPGPATGAPPLLPSPPVRLDDDYLYSTLVRPRRHGSLNRAHVHLAYGSQSGDPALRGTMVDGRA
jgi:hypothetical protein